MSKQIHISFHHDGKVVSLMKGRKQYFEDFLLSIWNSFGTVTNVIYHKTYASCIITYQNHHSAVFAYAGLNDPIQFQVAKQLMIGPDTQYAEFSKLFFIESTTHSNEITPTWID